MNWISIVLLGIIAIVITGLGYADVTAPTGLLWKDTGRIVAVVDSFDGNWYSSYEIATAQHGTVHLSDGPNGNMQQPTTFGCYSYTLNLTVGQTVGIIERVCGYEIVRHP